MGLVLCIDWFIFVILFIIIQVNALSFTFPVSLLRGEGSLTVELLRGQDESLMLLVVPMGFRAPFGRPLSTTLSYGSQYVCFGLNSELSF